MNWSPSRPCASAVGYRDTPDQLEPEVAELLELTSIDHEPAFTIAARRSNQDEPASSVQNAWAGCVRGEGHSRNEVAKFSVDELAELAAELPRKLDRSSRFA